MTAVLLVVASGAALADQYVNGHTRSDGTYVAPHYRSEPNSTQYDNYSSKGNYNPYTGERGSQDNTYKSRDTGLYQNTRRGTGLND